MTSKRKENLNVGDVVAQIDAVLLAVEGAAHLAWSGEFADKPSLIIIEVAAVLDLATEKLNTLSRELTGTKDP